MEASTQKAGADPDLTVHHVNEHIRLIQRRDGLTFGTDAYLTAAYVRAQPRARAVDLGSGTGIIPLLCLARNKAASFTAVEIQPLFCDVIRQNGVENCLSHRLTPLCADIRSLTAEAVGGEVDLVTANPPYLAAGTGARNQSDEKYIARHEVAGTVYDFCAAAGRVLKHGGRFVCVFRPERLPDLMEALRQAHLEPKRMTQVQATPLARPSLLLVEAVKFAAPSLRITPPLCLWQPDPERPERPDPRMIPSEMSEYVYSHCAFPETGSSGKKRSNNEGK